MSLRPALPVMETASTVSQQGDGFLGITNRTINNIEGDDNQVSMEQGDGGHWSYNRDMTGSGNKVSTLQIRRVE